MGITEYLINDTFGSYDVGNFASNDLWTVVNGSSSNSVTIGAEADGNQYLRLFKSANSNMAAYNKADLNLSGIVTFEARMKRTVDSASTNQFGMYSYNSADWNSVTPPAPPTPSVPSPSARGRSSLTMCADPRLPSASPTIPWMSGLSFATW